jgi:voltage-gated potassium channel
VAGINAVEIRRYLATVFEDEEPRGRVTRAFDLALACLIIVNVSCVILESVESIRRHLAWGFDLVENASTAFFAVEYLLRVWACVDLREISYRDPLWGRLRYVRSFFALIDLVSVLPAVLGFFGAADLRVLRLLRLLRMLKLVRHSTTFGLLFAVMREEARSVAALLFVLLLTVTISGSLMYMLENEVQPEVFTSIPVAMWWAIETLTTVGYGDIVPMTVAGRIVGGCVSIIGIATLALFSGLITVGFLDQLRIYREQHPRQVHGRRIAIEPGFGSGVAAADQPSPAAAQAGLPAICPHCGVPLGTPATRRDAGNGNEARRA